MRRFRTPALQASAGVALTAAYAPLSWFPLAVLVPAAALWWWRSQTPRQAVFAGWIFGFAHFASSFYWVYYSLHDFGQASAALAAAAAVVFAAVLAIYFAALAAAVSWSARRVRGACLCLLLYPSLWTLVEYLRGILLTGFPWNFVGQAMVGTPFAGVLPIAGGIGGSWLAVFLAGCITLMVASRSSRIAAGVAFGAVLAGASALSLPEWTAESGDPVEVALVQANIEQDIKFDREIFERIVDTYRGLTHAALGADLVLWPETALPPYYDLLEREGVLPPTYDRISRAGGEFVLGAFVRDRDGHAYNAIVRAGQTPQVYRKRHLVPLGEYFPLRSLLRFVDSLVLIPMSDLQAGDGVPLLRVGEHDVGVSICYEVSFADEVRDALPSAGYLINVSNDSWFGDSSAPHQHLQIARLRAIETGRPMARATSTGISALIDHRGNIVERSRQFTEQVIVGFIQPRSGATPYASRGDLPILILSVLLTAGCFMARRDRNTKGC